MEKENLVTFLASILLKSLGYPQEEFFGYSKDGTLTCIIGDPKPSFSAPSEKDAYKFLKDIHLIDNERRYWKSIYEESEDILSRIIIEFYIKKYDGTGNNFWDYYNTFD